MKVSGQFGKEVEFDFSVEGHRMRSLVQILSTANRRPLERLSRLQIAYLAKRITVRSDVRIAWLAKSTGLRASGRHRGQGLCE